MTFDQAADIAQRCADESGVDQAIAHDTNGNYFVFTMCDEAIDVDAVVAPSYIVI